MQPDSNDPNEKEKQNKFILGIVLGFLYPIFAVIVVVPFAYNIIPGISVLICFFVVIGVLAKNRQFEIIKGFILGTIVFFFIAAGTCFILLSLFGLIR